jgi:hypothetical protein
MHIINAHFESLDVMPVTALFGAIGVYVLWSARAEVRASYMGEGVLIERFARHIERFGKTTSGYAAIMSDERSDSHRKSDAAILETILLHIGGLIDQRPVHNDADGRTNGLVDHYNAGHKVVRINVTGYHPLRWGTKLQVRTPLNVDLSKHGDEVVISVDHPWRRIG